MADATVRAADKLRWTTNIASAGTYRVTVVATGPGGRAAPTISNPVAVP
jgi:hypothetical protein